MKVCVVAAVLVAACGWGVAQTNSSRATVQRALGFEDQTGAVLTGWHAAPPGTVSADNSVFHSGKWSVRLERDANSAGGQAVISRSLPVDFAGGVVELRGYLRLKDVSGDAGFWMRQDADGHSVALRNMQTQQLKGTKDWTQYSLFLPVNPEAQELYFGVIMSGTGTVWADDLELLVDGKPIADAASAPVKQSLPVDHEFDSGSKVALDGLTAVQVENLATLARVWGFLKYHHPVVTAGQRHWDYELFRILPAVLAAGDRAQANEAMVAWIDKLGPVSPCGKCADGAPGELDIKPALDWIHDRKALGAGLSERLEAIYAGRTGKQFFVSAAFISHNPSFDHELDYGQMKFPDSGYQLLALFRWWNILQYWAPDREVAGQDWGAVLAEFIPKLALVKDKTAYQLALFELIAKANDTHANVWSALYARPPVGDCALPGTLRFVGDKLVVYRVGAGDSGFEAGDVIEELDGASVSSLIGKWARYYADSNEAARRRDLAANLTRGACGAVQVGITRGGKLLTVAATRVKADYTFATHDKAGETFQMLSADVAYVKLSSIRAVDLAGYFERAKGTKGMIVDIRNYPSEFMPFAMGAYLATKPTTFVTFTALDLANPGAFHFGDEEVIEPGPVHYGGKVVILVDETSQSQAEYTAMALRAMPGAVVVGSTTAGADGNVSSIPLPGRLDTMISGLGVFYPDHRPTQRVGIVPDVVVRPTIEGIAAGRDEVLEAAVGVIAGAR